MKTLIVEDEFVSRMILTESLHKYGECVVAVNGKEGVLAFHIARNSGMPFDLVLLDMMMEEMNGLEALKEIRRIEQNDGISIGDGVKVIIISALKDMATVFDSYHNFCDDYLVKPINLRRLLEILQTLKLIEA
jgi:two-component system, chemotaxis family, chemotaxis protein CheY